MNSQCFCQLLFTYMFRGPPSPRILADLQQHHAALLALVPAAPASPLNEPATLRATAAAVRAAVQRWATAAGALGDAQWQAGGRAATLCADLQARKAEDEARGARFGPSRPSVLRCGTAPPPKPDRLCSAPSCRRGGGQTSDSVAAKRAPLQSCWRPPWRRPPTPSSPPPGWQPPARRWRWRP